MTSYEYDDAGRLVRSTTVVESEWDEQAQNEVLALLRVESMTCSGCGGWLPETTTVDAEGWVVEPPHRCGRCTALAIAQDRHGKDHQHMQATRWGAHRK